MDHFAGLDVSAFGETVASALWMTRARSFGN